MARNPEYIIKELEKLGAATVDIDQTLQKLYQEYFDLLGKAVKRQLVLAVYHLCTQVYPNDFLELTVVEREKFHREIRKIAAQAYEQIVQLGSLISLDSADLADGELAAEAGAEAVTTNPKLMPIQALLEDSRAAQGGPGSLALSQAIAGFSGLLVNFAAEPSPLNLAKRHALLERCLRSILQVISNGMNGLLKQVHILPDLPEIVLAAAAEAEASEPGNSSIPNLLNALVEVGSDRRREDSDDDDPDEDEADENEEEPDNNMTHLVAVNLKLADIEFADAHTALWRTKIQETLARLKQLGNRYQKLHREKAQAEAEYAWRAIWFEE